MGERSGQRQQAFCPETSERDQSDAEWDDEAERTGEWNPVQDRDKCGQLNKEENTKMKRVLASFVLSDSDIVHQRPKERKEATTRFERQVMKFNLRRVFVPPGVAADASPEDMKHERNNCYDQDKNRPLHSYLVGSRMTLDTSRMHPDVAFIVKTAADATRRPLGDHEPRQPVEWNRWKPPAAGALTSQFYRAGGHNGYALRTDLDLSLIHI